MNPSFVSTTSLPEISLWERGLRKNIPFSLDLEVTARCNNDCRHCYINLAAGDREAKQRELSLAEIGRIADETIELGALWCLISGGEPLVSSW